MEKRMDSVLNEDVIFKGLEHISKINAYMYTHSYLI